MIDTNSTARPPAGAGRHTARVMLAGFAVLAFGGIALDGAAAKSLKPRIFDGKASYYAYTGKTASGERTNRTAFTAAHRTLPFGTKVKVTDKRTGRTVIVRINDRGPFIRGRVLDLSLAAARALGITGRGVTTVHAEVM